MRRLFLLVTLLLVAPIVALGQTYTAVRGFCEAGAQAVVTSGLTSTTQVQASYPQCTVTVNIHGGSLATIFSTSSGGAQTNPFTAQTNGQWIFYGVSGVEYDIVMSGGGLPSSVTLSDIFIPPNQTGTITTGDCTKWTSSTTLGDAGAGCGVVSSLAWSSLGNATANLTLANSTFNTTLNQTNAALWQWQNTTAATSGASANSPVLELTGQYWTGAASANDLWSAQNVVGSGTNGTSTLTLAHSGSSGTAAVSIPLLSLTSPLTIANGGTGQVSASSAFNALAPPTTAGGLIVGSGANTYTNLVLGANTTVLTSNGSTAVWSAPTTTSWSALTAPTANLTLSNAGFTSTFNQTSGVTWQWANTTAATPTVAQPSPILDWRGTFWNGSVSANDDWTSQNVLGTGTNGTSTLTFAHSGTSGTSVVLIPTLTLTNALAIAQGGTGQTTASAAFNALAPATASGGFIIGTGANTYGNTPGPLPVANGGTGAATLAAAGITTETNVTKASGNVAVTTTTLVASAAAGTYQILLYAYDSAAGAGCTGNTSVVWTIGYTDPTSTAQTQTATETITTNGGATGGDKLATNFTVDAKVATAITYATSYTLGTGCTTGPSYAADLKPIQ